MKRLFHIILVFGLLAGGAEASRKSDALAMGRAALEDGLYVQAEDHFRAYIALSRKRGDRARGTAYLAEALYGQERYDDAEALLRDKADLAEGLQSEGTYRYWLAKCALAQGRYPDVVHLLATFEIDFPDHRLTLPALRVLSRGYLQTGQRSEALEQFERIQERFGDDEQAADNLLDWGTALLNAGRRREGREILESLANDHPGTSAAVRGQVLLAELLMAEDEHEASLELLTELVGHDRLAPDIQAVAWEQMARQQVQLTNLAAAAEAFGAAAGLTFDEGPRAVLLARQGRALVEAGALTNGLALFQQSIVAIPDRAEAARMQRSMGRLLLDLGHAEEAEEAMQHYLEAFADQPGLAEAHQAKGWALWQLERFAESASAFEKAFESSTNAVARAEALAKSADALFADQQYSEARSRYQVLVETFPASPLAPQARYQMAECLARSGSVDEAIEAFAALSALKGSPAVAREASLRVANLYAERGEWASAETAFAAALEGVEEPAARARALYGRGLVRYRSGTFKEALADFETLVTTLPADPLAEQAFYLRGWCHYLLGNKAAAVTICKEFLARYPASDYAPSVLFWLAEYYYNEGEFAEAEAGFASLAETYPDGNMTDAALYWAGRAAADQKEYLRAIDHFAALSKRFPDSDYAPQTRFAQGDALSQLGRFAGAILAFEEVIKKYPGSYLVNRAWGRMGDCQFTLGTEDPQRYRKAMACYQAILDDPGAENELRMQAQYKIARCHEKLDEQEKALDHFSQVIYAYFLDLERGEPVSDLWLTRSAFGAASLLEEQGQWRQAIRMYERVLEAGVPASDEAKERIQKLRLEHWLPFLKDEAEAL